MANRQELEQALIKAHDAGNAEHAKVFADAIREIDSQQQKPLGRPRDILGMPVKAAVKGLLGLASGQVAGGARSAAEMPGQFISGERVSGNYPAGQRVKEDVESSPMFQYEPTSKMGQIGTEIIGKGIETIGDYTEEVPAYIAARLEEGFGDPERAEQTAQMVRDQGSMKALRNRLLDAGAIGPAGYMGMGLAPEAVEAATIGGWIKHSGKKSANIFKELRERQKQAAMGQQKVAQPQPRVSGQWGKQPDVSGMDDADLANFKISNNNKLIEDFDYPLLKRKGLSPERATSYKAETPATRKAMLKMTDLKRQSMTNEIIERPADIVGETLTPRINYVRVKNKQAADELDRVAKNLKGKPIDFSYDRFVSSMEGVDINLKDVLNDKAFWNRGNKEIASDLKEFIYKNSDIENLPKFQRPLTNVLIRIGRSQQPDAYDLHSLKRFIDKNVVYGKKNKDNDITFKLKTLRKELGDTLKNDPRFNDYKRVNEQYADTIDILSQIQDLLPSKIDLDSPRLSSALGRKMRVLEQNYAARDQLIIALDDLEQIAKKYGANYNENIISLARYTTDLEKMLGAEGRLSINRMMEDTAELAAAKARKPGLGERAKRRILNPLAPGDKQTLELLENMLSIE